MASPQTRRVQEQLNKEGYALWQKLPDHEQELEADWNVPPGRDEGEKPEQTCLTFIMVLTFERTQANLPEPKQIKIIPVCAAHMENGAATEMMRD